MSESGSFLQSVKGWFSAEVSEAAETKRKVARRLEEDLNRKEAELEASPAERLENIQGEIESSDSSFDEIRSKIQASTTQAELDPDTSSTPDGQP